MQTGWVKVGSTWYHFAAGGAMDTGWLKSGSSWYYFESSGAMVTGWKQIDGKWYYFESGGAMVAGEVRTINGKNYRFQPGGAMITGWYKVAGSYSDAWYYYGSSGAMATGWQKISGTWYYFEPDEYSYNYGEMYADNHYEIDGRMYRFRSSGALVTGWYQRGTDWFYYTSGGAAATGFTRVGSYDYYFRDNGQMFVDDAIGPMDDGYSYGIAANGHAYRLKKNGWTRAEDYWFYCIDGARVKSCTRRIGGSYYAFDDRGRMIVSGMYYYYDSSYQTRYTYFASASGTLYTNQWYKYGGYWYYLGSDGQAYLGTHTIGGKSYTFDRYGRCTNP